MKKNNMKIIDTIKEGLNSSDPFEFISKELSFLYVNADECEILLFKKELESDSSALEVESLIDDQKKLHQVQDIIGSLKNRLNNNPFFKDKDGYWVHTNNGDNGEEYYNEVSNKFNDLKELNLHERTEKNVNKMFLSLMDDLLRVERIARVKLLFYPKNLVEYGCIQEEENYLQKIALEAIEMVEEFGVKIDRKNFMSLMSMAVVGGNQVIVDRLVRNYGDLEKDGNYLICAAIYDWDTPTVLWLIPKLNSFIVNCKWEEGKEFHNPGDKVYDVAKKSGLTSFNDLDELIKNSQERSELNEIIKTVGVTKNAKSL